MGRDRAAGSRWGSPHYLGGVELLLVAAATLIVVIVALVFVGWAVGKTAEMPDQIVIDAEEGIEFCAEALPVEVTSVLTYDELRRLLRLHLEWVQVYHWAPATEGDGPALFEELDSVDYLVERADVVGLDVSRETIVAVIKAHSAYLQVMGAIHLEDPVIAERDLADLPMLDGRIPPAIDEAGEAVTEAPDDATS
ncbi:MAG: hypothetical protein GY773_09885 [Actinomycetia bacterium]|nr:hypothetical protein [Actinomycetes bacterium]